MIAMMPRRAGLLKSEAIAPRGEGSGGASRTADFQVICRSVSNRIAATSPVRSLHLKRPFEIIALWFPFPLGQSLTVSITIHAIVTMLAHDFAPIKRLSSPY